MVLFTTLLYSFSSQDSFSNLSVVRLNVCLGPRLPVFPYLLALSLVNRFLSCSQRRVRILLFGDKWNLFCQSYFYHADLLNWYDKFDSLNIHKASLLVDLILCKSSDRWHARNRHRHRSITIIIIIWLLVTRTTVLLLKLFEFVIDYIWYRLLKNVVLLQLHLLMLWGRMRLLSVRQYMASLKDWLIYRSTESRFISNNCSSSSSSTSTGGRSIVVKIILVIVLTVHWTWSF